MNILHTKAMSATKEKDIDFVDYLLRQDETSIVLKCHLRLEREIDQLISSCIKRPGTILKWSFADKVDVLHANGLIGIKIIKDFKTINNIRNKFSHTFDYRLVEEDLNLLKKIGSGTEVNIPKEFQNFPNIKEIILLVRAVASLGAHLEIQGEIWKTNPHLSGLLSDAL
jgi:hypothetical protein